MRDMSRHTISATHVNLRPSTPMSRVLVGQIGLACDLNIVVGKIACMQMGLGVPHCESSYHPTISVVRGPLRPSPRGGLNDASMTGGRISSSSSYAAYCGSSTYVCERR